MGDCIMPREGVFARVLEPGTIRVGDEMTIEPRKGVRPWQAAARQAWRAPYLRLAWERR